MLDIVGKKDTAPEGAMITLEIRFAYLLIAEFPKAGFFKNCYAFFAHI